VTGRQTLAAIPRGKRGPSGFAPVPAWTDDFKLGFVDANGDPYGPLPQNLLGPEGPAGDFQNFDTRTQAIATVINTALRSIRVLRYALGYPLAPAVYIPGSSAGPMAFQDAGSNWWQLDISGGVCALEWFGGRGDNSTDNAPAFNAWWASMPTPGSWLTSGAGKFLFGSAIDKTMANARQSVRISGAGGDLTRWYWPAGGGMKISQANNLNSVHIHDLTITTGAVNVGTGLWLLSPGIDIGFTGSQSEVRNVNFSGDDYTDQAANSFYWAEAFKGQGWSNLTVDNCNTYGLIGAPGSPGGGRGFIYGGFGGGSTSISGIAVFNDCNSYFQEVGADLGDYWEGVIFNNYNVQGETGVAGINCDESRVHAQYLTIKDSQFNSAGYQVVLNAPIPKLKVLNNTFAVFANTGGLGGVVTAGLSSTGDSPVIIGNIFDVTAGASNTVGVALSDTTKGVIQSNIFIGLKAGINLSSTTSNINVSQNVYESVTTPVVNAAGAANHVGVATS
jgi:hypothetical protein